MTGPTDTRAARFAALHATAFETPWDEAAFAGLLDQAGVFACETADGFILMRGVADEAEILTLAVRPEARGQGQGAQLVVEGVALADRNGADRVFLEVAEDNAPALALYGRAGFVQTGQRPRYYARPDGSRVDALLFTLNLSGRLP